MDEIRLDASKISIPCFVEQSASPGRVHQENETINRPNANTAYIAITALIVFASVCILLITKNRPDLWPTVAMIGSLCGFGAIMSFFVTRPKP
jgi:1,4-dihydroxy-2-naphthoate octaprenyltransferase